MDLILHFSIFRLRQKCDVTSHVTKCDRDITSITVTQLYNTEKNIEGSKINDII